MQNDHLFRLEHEKKLLPLKNESAHAIYLIFMIFLYQKRSFSGVYQLGTSKEVWVWSSDVYIFLKFYNILFTQKNNKGKHEDRKIYDSAILLILGDWINALQIASKDATISYLKNDRNHITKSFSSKADVDSISFFLVCNVY